MLLHRLLDARVRGPQRSVGREDRHDPAIEAGAQGDQRVVQRALIGRLIRLHHVVRHDEQRLSSAIRRRPLRARLSGGYSQRATEVVEFAADRQRRPSQHDSVALSSQRGEQATDLNTRGAQHRRLSARRRMIRGGVGGNRASRAAVQMRLAQPIDHAARFGVECQRYRGAETLNRALGAQEVRGDAVGGNRWPLVLLQRIAYGHFASEARHGCEPGA